MARGVTAAPRAIKDESPRYQQTYRNFKGVFEPAQISAENKEERNMKSMNENPRNPGLDVLLVIFLCAVPHLRRPRRLAGMLK